MRIIIDAMGGDNAPEEIVRGAFMAMDELGIEISLAGRENEIKACAEKNGLDISKVTIIPASDVVSMDDDPANVLKTRKDSSMIAALNALAAGEGDALVSAGNTGALLVGATLIVKRIRGIRRAALAAVLPTAKGGSILLDSGANAECTAEMLTQFAFMGKCYAQAQSGIDNPAVGLINNGSEPTKGTPLQQETYTALSNLNQEGKINFIGNIEGRDVASGNANVLVCDGFTGNILLKTYEGVGLFLVGEMKKMFKKSPITMLSALLIKKYMKEFKAKIDYKEVGGAPLLGISKPVIKAHGSSDALAVKNAVKQAKIYAESKMIEQICSFISSKE